MKNKKKESGQNNPKTSTITFNCSNATAFQLLASVLYCSTNPTCCFKSALSEDNADIVWIALHISKDLL